MALSLLYGVGLFFALVLLGVLLGRVLPESVLLIVLYSWFVLGPLGVAFLWLVGSIVSNKWDRTSAWAMLKLWWVWLTVVGEFVPGHEASPRHLVIFTESLACLVAVVGPLIVLLLVRTHYRDKWRGEVRPLDGTI